MGLARRRNVIWRDRFNRAQALTTTPGENGWTIKDTSSAGTPTYLMGNVAGGALSAGGHSLGPPDNVLTLVLAELRELDRPVDLVLLPRDEPLHGAFEEGYSPFSVGEYKPSGRKAASAPSLDGLG